MNGRTLRTRGRPWFWQDTRGASAVEFAIVSLPFFLMVLCIMQVGIYYMVQSSLDAGVVRTAEVLRDSFMDTGTPAMPGAGTLKSDIASRSGGLIRNDSTLAVELRQLASLSGGAVAITDGTTDYGTTTSALVLRASASVVTFLPGLPGLAVAQSSAIVRRQGR